MKIRISEIPSKEFYLQLPTGLLLNGLTTPALAKTIKQYGINLSIKDTRLLIRAAKRYKKEHPDWKLVEVYSAKGERVEIRL